MKTIYEHYWFYTEMQFVENELLARQKPEASSHILMMTMRVMLMKLYFTIV